MNGDEKCPQNKLTKATEPWDIFNRNIKDLLRSQIARNKTTEEAATKDITVEKFPELKITYTHI